MRTKTAKPKPTDAERHARFVETARQVGASDDPNDFEKAFEAVTQRPPTEPLKQR